jgi:elongation factor P--(R)-beta-lysine ligase
MTIDTSWRPVASLDIIKQRATLLRQIREFMECRHILEVDTPVLSHYAISDPYIHSMSTVNAFEKETSLYLHTSPEFCMKRLIAAGTGSIYQIAHVFRDEESGTRHQTEFSMLEWYRTGFDYYQLMDDISDLLQEIGLSRPEKKTYAQVFLQSLQIDPHTVDIKQLQDLASHHGWVSKSDDRHALLDYIFSEVVMKEIDNNQSLIIYDYPECMAALATLKEGTPRVAERFELFINGMEIANGFNELCDAKEQKERFDSELLIRKDNGLPELAIDKNFLTALESELPKTAGVAVGIERLLMVLSGKNDIKEVSAFSLHNN